MVKWPLLACLNSGCASPSRYRTPWNMSLFYFDKFWWKSKMAARRRHMETVKINGSSSSALIWTGSWSWNPPQPVPVVAVTKMQNIFFRIAPFSKNKGRQCGQKQFSCRSSYMAVSKTWRRPQHSSSWLTLPDSVKEKKTLKSNPQHAPEVLHPWQTFQKNSIKTEAAKLSPQRTKKTRLWSYQVGVCSRSRYTGLAGGFTLTKGTKPMKCLPTFIQELMTSTKKNEEKKTSPNQQSCHLLKKWNQHFKQELWTKRIHLNRLNTNVVIKWDKTKQSGSPTIGYKK